MTEAAYLIPVSALQGFPVAARDAILDYFGIERTAPAAPAGPAAPTAPAVPANPAAQPQEDGPVEMTLALVRKLTKKPINPKTLAVLRAIARSDTPQFRLSDIIASVDGVATYLDLRGSWSGLTRRTRYIFNDGEVDLIWWDDVQNEDGIYVDHVGEVAKLTHESLRTYFGF